MNGDTQKSTYPGGVAGLLAQMEARRDPLTFAEGEALPGLDVDLDALAGSVVPPVAEDPLGGLRVASSNHRKLMALRKELAGSSELAVLHGLLIAHLRKRSQPGHTATLFERLWTEQSDHLLHRLDPRWLVSATTTFGDHGRTPAQRRVGAALSVLFGTMKLYESERRFSGQPSDKPFPLDRLRKTPLPMAMDPFALARGGLDVNMLGRLWRDAETDETIRPLAHALLAQVIEDPHTIFRRLRIMRTRLERKRAQPSKVKEHKAGGAAASPPTPSRSTSPAKTVPVLNVAPTRPMPSGRSKAPNWGVVCTTNAPLSDITAWAAHYLDLGATHLHLFLDAPDDEVAAFFAGHPSLTLQTCDAAFWARQNKPRPTTHQQRQAHNATLSLHRSGLDFLGHFDIDEFLISPVPVARELGDCPPSAACARVRPVELLAPINGPPRHFKRAHRPKTTPPSLLDALYPTFGPYLRRGMISHTSGKIFARTGLPETRFGLHCLKYRGQKATNQAELPRMALAHMHCRDIEHFLDRAAFRLEKGSYRKTEKAAEDMRLSDALAYLHAHEGEAGLRAFFDEACTARPDLLRKLDAHGLLLTHDLDLAGKVDRVFGPATTEAHCA